MRSPAATAPPSSPASAAAPPVASVAPSGPPGRVKVSGAGLGVVVNANAKRGGRRIAVELGRALPGARVRLTRSADELDAYLRSLLRDGEPRPRCILAAGGDGTAIALVNALRRVLPEDEPYPAIGLLPLGTGNAWAHAAGALKLGLAVRQLRDHASAVPTRRFGLIECEGILTTFAGCGWDAEVLNDYRAQVEAAKGPSRRLAKTVYGYLSAMVLRTVPKTLVNGRPTVLVENLGPTVHRVDAGGRVVLMDGVGRGSVLYEGPSGVAGCATCPEFGYQFRAYPFAERMPGAFNIRIFETPPLEAVRSIPRLWRGDRVRGMHDWFATEVRMTFSRPVPLQIAGDAVGFRQSVDYRMHPRHVDVLDWRAMG
ncbi:MAG: diacylglycerol kinase [Myxococcales bacterium]|nr:diacylglycerol kinase [Myxococcales bacterium]